MAKINFASGHVFESEGAVSVYEAARSLEIISRALAASYTETAASDSYTCPDAKLIFDILLTPI